MTIFFCWLCILSVIKVHFDPNMLPLALIVIDYKERISKLSPEAKNHLSSPLDCNSKGDKDLDELADFMINLEELTSALDIPADCVQDLQEEYYCRRPKFKR